MRDICVPPGRKFAIRPASAAEALAFGLPENARAVLLIRGTETLIDVRPSALLIAELPALVREATLERRWRQALAAGWQPLELGGRP